MSKYFFIISLTFLFSNQVIADSSYDRGKEKSVTCSACHGGDGNSENKLYPKLAGQYKNYLIHSLNAYKSGERQNAIMSGFAAGLSEQDIIDFLHEKNIMVFTYTCKNSIIYNFIKNYDIDGIVTNEKLYLLDKKPKNKENKDINNYIHILITILCIFLFL